MKIIDISKKNWQDKVIDIMKEAGTPEAEIQQAKAVSNAMNMIFNNILDKDK